MKNGKQSSSGQATTEMAVMLLGFAFLMVGLIFVFSMGIFNTRLLMEAKYNADCTANMSGAADAAGAGRELGGWEYKNGIPFTLKDEPVYRSGGEMTEAAVQMDANYASDAQNYTYEWMKLADFNAGTFAHDYKDRHDSAVAAAGLIASEGKNSGNMPLVSRLPELYTAAGRLLKVKISRESLLKNNSNRVYMPANGEL